ncbi:MAG: hypothetical protein HQK60_06600, partial [Deltaproteobacteria bacterium]|nr:hypothetical protein [Deltaproteobacteria bacterium]
KAENANGRHILIKPLDDACYLLADDLSWQVILSHHQYPDQKWKPGRMVVETSPQNYQVWIRSHRPLTLIEKRTWLKKLKSDPGADPNNRWGRCPGFRNRKDKYRDANGQYPLSRLIWIDWSDCATIPKSYLSRTVTESLSLQPQSGGVCHGKGQITRQDYERGNESATDFSYALALIRKGYSDEQISRRIIEERTSWQNHHGQPRITNYLDRTIRRARALAKMT